MVAEKPLRRKHDQETSDKGIRSLGKSKRFVSPQRSFLNKADELNTVVGVTGETALRRLVQRFIVQGQVYCIQR